jgi:hypothetical protein
MRSMSSHSSLFESPGHASLSRSMIVRLRSSGSTRCLFSCARTRRGLMVLPGGSLTFVCAGKNGPQPVNEERPS